MHPLYTLTKMTGREAAEQRTMVIGTVELNSRLWFIIFCSAPVSLIVTAICWPFLGQYALVMIPIVIGAASVLFYRRSRSGLQLRTYQTLLDQRRAKDVSDFYLCGQPIEIGTHEVRRLMPASAPYGRPEEPAPATEQPLPSFGTAASTVPLSAPAPSPLPATPTNQPMPAQPVPAASGADAWF